MLFRSVDLLYNFGQLELTGLYDEETAARVRQFQQRNQLPTTGIVDRITWDRLAAAYSVMLSRE